MCDHPALKPGDLVKLRSGGPTMTIGTLSLDPAGRWTLAECHWFTPSDYANLDMTRDKREARIPLACLEPANQGDAAL